ncbi:hypothetical protein SPBR_05846 [Sporothrix brasiliensis 5110]|uniref:Uncharacterized protein n=1 Tax=Sporothrix brasiliensis 5110 TaxID=1398154 RepID=A0A0C2FUB7_9PEZI|nr:uncharacterized protein SPBR_05846 [Sporothrix brasiliensis 5110]KIH94593.1 hypothetical protein SPBR_05846 [Sporothrix brasiliensis 5110]
MRVKFLHRRARKGQQQPEVAVLVSPSSQSSPPSPSSTPPATAKSSVAASTASDDGHSLKRRTSALSSIPNLSLRTSFGRMRRPRSPPPPYALTDTSVPKPDDAVSVVTISTAAAEQASEDVEAITVVKQASSPTHDPKTVATVDVKTMIDVKTDSKVDSKVDSKADAEEAAEELLLDVATAPFNDLPLPSSREVSKFRRLAHPVVVPRLHHGNTVPFARGYAPCLGDTHGIDTATFLAFIDGLNLVTSPHPAVMILSIVSFAMEFVPLDYANGIGAVAQLLAEVTAAIVAYKRGKIFLARANAMLFEPRGLHVSIANTKRMRAILGIAPKAPLLAPLSEETVELATLERCMRHFNDSGWAAALELETRTGCLMPMAKPSYREAAADVAARWHPDYVADRKEKKKSGEGDDDGSEVDDTDDGRPPALRRAPSTWETVGCAVNHGLAIVADKHVRFDIKMAEKEARRARRRAWKRYAKGKKLKEPFGEKYRVRHLSWILVRNLDDVRQEKAEKAAAHAAKKAAKTAGRTTKQSRAKVVT